MFVRGRTVDRNPPNTTEQPQHLEDILNSLVLLRLPRFDKLQVFDLESFMWAVESIKSSQADTRESKRLDVGEVL